MMSPDKNKLKDENATLKQLLEEKERENKKLRKTLSTVKTIFKKHWHRGVTKWKKLRPLWKEQKKLQGTLDGHKETIREMGRRDKETQVLDRKLKKLKDRLVILPQVSNNCREVGVTERKEARAIFPEEIWEMILGNVKDSRDLWACTNTCRLFDRMLSPWKTGWLLEQTMPNLYRHLPREKILECRLVCKSWKEGVDHFLENHPSLRPHNVEGGGSDPGQLTFVNPMKEKELGEKSYNLMFKILPEPDDDLDDDAPPPPQPVGNPFIGRNIILNIEDSPGGSPKGRDALWAEVYKFFADYGKEIWYMTVVLPGSPTSKMRELLTVDMFGFIPNIRKIGFRSKSNTLAYAGDPQDQIGSVTPPMSSLPHLETIEDDWKRHIRAQNPFSGSLLHGFNLQLGKLYLQTRSWEQVNQLEWPNLYELHLTDIGQKKDLESLFGARIPNLTKLGLIIDTHYLPIHCLIKAIHQVSFLTRLNTLRLEGMNIVKIGRMKTKSDCFIPPSLKTLEISHSWEARSNHGPLPSYTFLLRYFPLVENIHLYTRRKGDYIAGVNDNAPSPEIDLLPLDKCRKQVGAEGLRKLKRAEVVEVNKYCYEGNMYKSNIWELMPLLKVFSFQWDVFTREGYEKYKMN